MKNFLEVMVALAVFQFAFLFFTMVAGSILNRQAWTGYSPATIVSHASFASIAATVAVIAALLAEFVIVPSSGRHWQSVRYWLNAICVAGFLPSLFLAFWFNPVRYPRLDHPRYVRVHAVCGIIACVTGMMVAIFGWCFVWYPLGR